MSERTLLERSASEKAVVTEKPQEKSDAKSADAKPSDTPVETASIPAEPRRHTPAPREKVRVVLPSPVQPSAAAPVTAVPAPAPPVEAAVAPEERRDANDLARAAIERLRGNGDSSPRPQEAARTPEAPRAPEASRSFRNTPCRDRARGTAAAAADHGFGAAEQRSVRSGIAGKTVLIAANAGNGDRAVRHRRLTFRPRDRRLISVPTRSRPPPREHKSVAEDVLSAAKSVFHAVLPK